MKISELLDPRFMNLFVEAADKDAALRAVTELARAHPEILDFDAFSRSVQDRESLGSTSIGHAVAIPHARTDHVRKMVLIVGRVPAGVTFDARDVEPVRFIFMVGTPKQMITDYLRVIGSLARCMKDPEFRGRLLAAKTPEEFIELFRAKEG
ncbi:MAG: PTS sugar transporter subunit IIA [Verrucomicrobiae bacterium]|nr:PTS sugar transporter subunit IIA [Verrucomicrobiae bacterium]